MALQMLANTDELTDLLNRRAFMRAGAELIRNLYEERRNGALMYFLDVDGLRRINDTLGHAAGDEVLKRAAAIMRSVFRPDDLLGRLGGDEFAALSLRRNGREAEQTTERLQRATDADNASHGLPHVSLSIGHTQVNMVRPQTLSEVLSIADTAMFGNKLGKLMNLGNVVATDPAMP